MVEDNGLNMKLVKALLASGGYRVLEAMDAEAGIELAREKEPDLILMDIQLPGMDGLDATRVIKNDPALRDIPVLAITSHAMRGDREKALAAGCDGYISKPIETRGFIENLAKYIK